ncbi:MAG: hypothetical protein N4J56_003366 [Chroococcidiopsis sp. SAG 2025]|uniref:phospholipase D-like domain-containing protein n=1 Tax=Chroococcidiopsis sp. SAG 2025 TaxID=171389 RepID=UPI002936EE9A|nr:phospholipase D-like domain-containing protein [Chroococcidiopsis sp. SAG 2025]MDV2993712.1 hypothetical protein [Chroococcidiopsis sp. SAG 2025]
MFLTSSSKPIESQLSEQVDKIEQQSPSLSVLAARQFRYKVYQTKLEVKLSKRRQFNVLEEFILRAGIELVPPPVINELASVLGLDSIFVQNTVATLRTLKIIENQHIDEIILTPQGQEFYAQGSLFQPVETKTIYAIADPLLGNLCLRASPLESVQTELPNFADLVSLDCRTPARLPSSLEELQQLFQEAKLGSSESVTSGEAFDTQEIWQAISVFAIFDLLEEKLKFHLRREKQILADASSWLEILESEGKVSLHALCQLSAEALTLECEEILKHKNYEVESRIEKIQQKAVDSIREIHKKEKDASDVNNVIVLRDRQIRQEFLKTLKSANSEILIYSPWVSEAVVDREFIRILQELANRGVWILIGHGYTRKQEDEDRPIPAAVEASLLSVKTPEGLPAVQIFWLGNSHAKEIVVDRKVHLSGSHNWLSYRGDKLPRGETVHKVTILPLVQEAYEFLAERFQSHAQKLWEEAILNRNSQLAITPLCVWGALEMHDEALNRIQHNSWLELLPLWLDVVHQRIRSQKDSFAPTSLTNIISLLNQFSPEDSIVEPLWERWQKIAGAIAVYNRNTAIMLLDEAWTEFIRLGIVQPLIESPQEVLAKFTVVLQQQAIKLQHKKSATQQPQIRSPQHNGNKKRNKRG